MRVLLLLFALLASSCLLSRQPRGMERTYDIHAEDELRRLVRAWDDATAKGDADVLHRILADEFTFVGGPAKAPFLDSVRSRSAENAIESAVSGDVQVEVYGDMAIVTGLDTVKGRNKGEPFTKRWRYTDVWVRRDGRWQCIKTHSSPTPNE
jgi:ketosteroid isomerase-like protein